MQMTETSLQKNSLFNAMNQFIGAVNKMDQTVMLPSMLRDLPVEEDSELGALKSDMDDGDMYSYYQLLKSIRRDMEWGVRSQRCSGSSNSSSPAADHRRKEKMTVSRTGSSASTASTDSAFSSRSSDSSFSSRSSDASYSSEEDEEDLEEDDDLEKQFQFHLTGLQGVLSKLTVQANCLTRRYKQELGIGEWGQ